MPVVTLTSDFGTRDPYVGAMRGVLLSVNDALQLADITHDVPAQDVLAGSYALRHAAPFFPAGTVHLAVVDPGVGSARRPIVVDDGTHRWVGPDNGLFSHVLTQPGVSVFEIAHDALRRDAVSATFHGRDLFAPTAAHLASGWAAAQVGPTIRDPVRLDAVTCSREGATIRGHVIHVDHFGNLVTDVGRIDVASSRLRHVELGGTSVTGLSTTYADVGRDEPLVLFGSGDLLEISVRDGHAADTFGVGRGADVTVHLEESA